MNQRSGNALRVYEQFSEDKVFYQGMSDLNMLATHFVRRTFLQDLRRMPRLQDLPEEALWMQPPNRIFVSHPWLTAHEPNHETLNAIRSFVPNDPDVGVWIDYCCLPQKRTDGTDDRTPVERQFFRCQLQYIPTILLKSQLIVLWSEPHLQRGWCTVELLIADIFRQLMNKQFYHCRHGFSESVQFVTQTYPPEEGNLTGGGAGQPVAKILMPHRVKDHAAEFYNFLLNRVGREPMLLTKLLHDVSREDVDAYFDAQSLECSNRHDIAVLKQLLYTVCHFAGRYDVSTIKWTGKVPALSVLPYIESNLADFSVRLIDYKFN